MAQDARQPLERFKVNGNVLKITPRFDPRYQSRAGMELMNIVSSLATEGDSSEVVLDISDAVSLPSMMLGIITEARDLTNKAGKKLKIRIKTATYNRMQSLGVGNVFPQSTAAAVEGSDEIELISDVNQPPLRDEKEQNGA